ncbi:PAS domain S-box protein [Catalinimonas niigatensis]|uniref:PAS domain S-box protein n=1 Tax=Catalinimonas niigatensis TaxID=1397264 RepID=UPI002665B564|nr:PAS domain S-box protein [Catalinimonas niigatensis]WPP52925.1 PAS domain S-box protein [Catalinimonas niigatensis]
MKTLQQAIGKVHQLESALETNRKEFEEKICGMEADMKELHEFAGIGWWSFHMQSGKIHWSDEVYRQYDWPLTEDTPAIEDYYQLIHPDYLELVKASFKKAYQSEKVTFEKCIVTKQKNIRYLKTTVKPLKNEKGEKLGLYGTTLDITDIREAKEALLREKEKYKLITDNAQDLICMHRPGGRYTYLSPSVEAVLGYTEAELLGKSPWYLMHPEEAGLLRNMLETMVLHDKAEHCVEYRIKRKDGKYIWLQTNTTPIVVNEQLVAFQTVSRNITEQRLAQDKLKISERNYRRLASNIPDTDIFLFDKDMRFVVADGAAMKRLNQSPEQYEGKHLEEALEGKVKAYFKPIFEATLQGESVHSDILTSEGVHFNHRTVPLRDEQGHIEGGLLVCQNISERKRAEEALLKLKDELEEAQLLARLGSWEVDIPSGKLSLSPQFRTLIDLPEGLEPGIHEGLSFFSRHSRQLFQRSIYAMMQEGGEFDLELEMDTALRERIWVRTLGKLLMQNGKPYKIKGIFQDISKAKKAELNLKHFQKGLKTLNMIASHSELDFDAQIDKALLEVANYLAMPVGMISMIDGELCHVKHFVKTEPYFPDLAHKYMPLDYTFCRQAYHQQDIIAVTHAGVSEHAALPAYQNFKMESFIGAPIRMEDRVYGVVSFYAPKPRVHPFTEEEKEFIRLYARWIGSAIERNRKEQELIEARKQAEHASMAKAQFLSTMSHEIRTPLNAVIGISYLLLQDDPKPEQVENLQALRFSGENLLALINDILDFSKIEAGKIEFEEADFNLKQLLTGIQKSLALKAEEKGLDLHLTYDDAIPKAVVGDPTRLSQIMNNLLSNAIKFTKEGSVQMRVSVTAQNQDKVDLSFEVQDSGIGIPEGKQTHIFDSFSQAASDTTRHYGGTGLGLAITKKLLELQGSQIQLSSKEGEGALFYFTLSFKKSNHTIEDKSAFLQGTEGYKSLEGYQVLLVEDNTMNVIVARQFLNKWKLAFDHAENGEEAVRKVNSGAAYNLVLMDLQMPVMDGYDATLQIRKTHPDLPIIALTASAMLEIQERVFKVGMNDFVSKPFNPKELYHKIVKHLQKTKQRA